MKSRTSHSLVTLALETGIPPHDFFESAWASEPLTGTLTNTNISFALPMPDETMSLIAKNDDGMVVGQCSANTVVTYWNHMNNIDASQQNLSTQTFIKIHKHAVKIEQAYLKQTNEPIHHSIHNAGIAVLPSYRGNKIGEMLTKKQMERCKQQQATTLFCETTNLFSANIMRALAFDQLAEYSYKDLAAELNHDTLGKLDDSFTIWCKKI